MNQTTNEYNVVKKHTVINDDMWITVHNNEFGIDRNKLLEAIGFVVSSHAIFGKVISDDATSKEIRNFIGDIADSVVQTIGELEAKVKQIYEQRNPVLD